MHSGEEYFVQLRELIRSAKVKLELLFYILDPDETGQQVLDELLVAARRGVKVMLAVDGFGSYGLFRKAGAKLSSEGISFRFFSAIPFDALRQPARRLHAKVAVADAARAIVGGINISDKYRGNPTTMPWLDYAVYVDGPICADLSLFAEGVLQKKYFRKKKSRAISGSKVPNTEIGIAARVSINDWLRAKNEISRTYRQMIRSVESELLIMNSYFIPSNRLLRLLVRKAESGKDVTLVLGGISDVPLVNAASRYLYARLLRAGVTIFEYQPSVLHAKICMADRRLLTIGSYNLNHLSEFFSVELNVDISNTEICNKLGAELDDLIVRDCKQVKLSDVVSKNHWTEQLRSYLSYRLIRFTRVIFSFFQITNEKSPVSIHSTTDFK